MSLISFAYPLAELLDHVEDVLCWIKDRDGAYCWVNRAFAINFATDALRDRPTDEAASVLGKTDYDLSPTFLADQFRLDDEYVLAGNRIVNRIEMVGPVAGSTPWNLTNKIPLVDPAGAVVGTAGLTRRLSSTSPNIVPESGFGSVLAHLRDHYDAPITNRELARLAHMSVRSFERKFRHNFHVTPQKYLRKLRLRIASRALVTTRDPLGDVALRSGFADQSHFAREFRRHFGRTPRAYRDHYAAGGGTAAPVTKVAADEQATGPPSRYHQPA